MTDDPPVPADAAALLRDMRDFVHRCQQLLDDDEEPDLSGMEERTRIMCASLKQLPRDEVERLNPKLDSLMEEFTALSAALEEQKARVRGQLGGLHGQQKAMSAYQRADQTRPPSTRPKIEPDEGDA